MMSSATKRSITSLDSSHLYHSRYSVMFIVRLKKFQITPPLFGSSSFLSLSSSGFWMYAGIFFAIIGVALWLGAYYLSGYGASYPESGRAIHRAEDFVGDSCATIEKIGLIGVNSSHDTAIKKKTSMKGVETKKEMILFSLGALPCENTYCYAHRGNHAGASRRLEAATSENIDGA